MQLVEPYLSIDAAIASLDNGGRFYNFFTKAGDGKVDPAELSKVAGVIGNKEAMFLFYELAISKLDSKQRANIKSAMSEELQSLYMQFKPVTMSPAEAKHEGQAGESCLVTGYPEWVDDTSKMTGFIMVPIVTGKITTFAMIPIFEKFNVYNVYDEEKQEEFLVAHAKSDNILDNQRYTFAGILKKMSKDKTHTESAGCFLEAFYYASAE